MRTELKRLAQVMRGRCTRVVGLACVAATVVSVTLLVFPAQAKPSAEELAVARQQFDKAVEAEGRNAWAECEEAIGEAIGIVETPGLRFHQAHCKEQQNKWVEALVDYKRAEELIAGGVRASDVEPLLEPAITRLDAKVPRLTVKLATIPPRVMFYLDSKERSSRLLGKMVQLNPGSHTIELAAPGYESVTRTISVKEGERSELTMSLEANPEATQPIADSNLSYGTEARTAPRERGEKPMSAKPFVLAAEGAVAAAALGLSLKFYWDKETFRSEKFRQINELGNPAGCAGGSMERACEAIKTVADKEKRYGQYALYWAIGGAGALAVLATTWLAWDDSPRVVVAYDPASKAGSFTLSGEF